MVECGDMDTLYVCKMCRVESKGCEKLIKTWQRMAKSALTLSKQLKQVFALPNLNTSTLLKLC